MAVGEPGETPEREAPEVEWSAALARSGVSTDRWVRYGMARDEIKAFLMSSGVHPEPLFEHLASEYGPPVQVACGRDGERGKLYWFLEGVDPYFIGVDITGGEVSAYKWYRGLEPAETPLASQVLPEALRPHLAWLLEALSETSAELFHLVLLSRSVPPSYSGVHVGLAPDWERLLSGDRGLLLQEVAEALCARLGLEGQLAAAAERLFDEPMAWTAYLSLVQRPDGSAGANIYTRASPVVHGDAGLSLVEPGPGGVLARPVVLTFESEVWPSLEVRLRTWGDSQCFKQFGPWLVDYSVPDGVSVGQDCLGWIEAVAGSALQGQGPQAFGAVAAALRRGTDTQRVRVGPDMRYGDPGR